MADYDTFQEAAAAAPRPLRDALETERRAHRQALDERAAARLALSVMAAVMEHRLIGGPALVKEILRKAGVAAYKSVVEDQQREIVAIRQIAKAAIDLAVSRAQRGPGCNAVCPVCARQAAETEDLLRKLGSV